MRYSLVISICTLLLVASAGYCEEAGQPAKRLEEMTLEELLNVQVSVATKTDQTVRTSPAIVTLITDEEIANMGARDLIDVLQMVPGITFGVDVEGVTSLSIRGNWAEEGKALLLWDGQEINEGLYGNIPLGNHFPVDQIKRIEIIRGPGSAVYGGFAELAVINIVTKSAEDLNGIEAHMTYSQMASTYGRRNLSVAAGKKFSDLVSLTFSAFAGQQNRTDRTYSDVNGNTYALADGNRMTPLMLNLGAKIENFELRFLVDQYRTTDRDSYGVNFSAPVRANFDGYYLSAKYGYKLNSRMTLTPYLSYKNQVPWESTGPSPQIFELPDSVYSVRYQRLREGLEYSWDITPSINLLTGISLDQEDAKAESVGAFSGASYYFFNDQAVYAQGVWNNEWVNVTLGARFNHHAESGNSFVPRLGLVKQVGDWNFKGLFSRAYRQPTIVNIDSNSGIKPENTTVVEFETGYRLNESNYVTANIYNISISDPIIYSYNASSTTVYQNLDKAGTRGVELQYKLKERWGYVNASYSFFQPISSGIASYSVPGQDNSFLGEPHHKLAAYSSIQTPLANIRVNPSILWLTTQWAYTYSDGAGGFSLAELSPTFLANLFLLRDDTFVKGLQLGLGLTNIFDSNYPLVQPYSVPGSNPHPPIAAPGGSREVLAKVGYSLPL